MRRAWPLAIFALALGGLAGCGEKNAAQPIGKWEAFQENLADYDFKVPRGAELYRGLVELYERYAKAGHPGSEPPLIAVYVTDDSFDSVVEFYERIYRTPARPFDEGAQPPAPPAYRRRVRFETEAAPLAEALATIQVRLDRSKLVGEHLAAHFDEMDRFPKVEISRPYFDVVKQEVVDETLIILAKTQR